MNIRENTGKLLSNGYGSVKIDEKSGLAFTETMMHMTIKNEITFLVDILRYWEEAKKENFV